MAFLYYDKEAEKVQVTEDGWALKEVKEVYANDRQGSGKPFFNKVITGIFFIYKPDGLYRNKPISERIRIVERDYFDDGSQWNTILHSKGVKELVEKYKDLCYTMSQRLLDGISEDVVQYLDLLNDVPYTRTIEFNHVFVFDGPEGHREVPVTEKVDVPNMTEKNKAYDSALKLSKMMKDVREQLREELAEREKEKISQRLYDEPSKSQTKK